MARIIRVETCEECPFGEKGSNAQGDWYLGCTKKLDGWGWNEPVSDIFIPDWCPLPEAEEDRWIPVGERLPEEQVDVLVLRKLRRLTVRGQRHIILSAFYHDGDWGSTDGLSWIGDSSVTHWRPLPDLPEEATNE